MDDAKIITGLIVILSLVFTGGYVLGMMTNEYNANQAVINECNAFYQDAICNLTHTCNAGITSYPQWNYNVSGENE